jgi:hypothetical protein
MVVGTVMGSLISSRDAAKDFSNIFPERKTEARPDAKKSVDISWGMYNMSVVRTINQESRFGPVVVSE